LGGVLLAQCFSTSAKIAAGNNAVGQADIGQLAAAGAGEEVNKVGSSLVERTHVQRLWKSGPALNLCLCQ